MLGGVREREMLTTPGRVTGEGEQLCHFPRGTIIRVDLDYWLKKPEAYTVQYGTHHVAIK